LLLDGSITVQDDDDDDDEDIRDEEDEDEDGDALIVTGPTPLAKIDVAQTTIAEIMADKPKTTASRLREQKVSGIVKDERGKFREMSYWNPYKYRRIMTPRQIQELYEDDVSTGDVVLEPRKREKHTLEMDEEQIAKLKHSHEVWSQDPDNVYEVILLLRELGFKTNQDSSVWPYTEFAGVKQADADAEAKAEAESRESRSKEWRWRQQRGWR